MPFTPAHPAIVLPLIRSRYFSATGLIVGSVSPDFEYFFKASVSGEHGHTLAGIFYFDLPVSIFLAFTFHVLIKESLIGNLPITLQTRLQTLREWNFKGFALTHPIILMISILIGALSHIFWDSFTHNGRYFVNLLPILRNTHIPLDGARYPLWYALQHLSTWVGLSIILVYVLYLPKREGVTQQPKLSYWIAMLFTGSVLFYLRFSLFTVRFDLGNAVVTAMSSLMLAVCLVSLLRYFKLSKNG